MLLSEARCGLHAAGEGRGDRRSGSGLAAEGATWGGQIARTQSSLSSIVITTSKRVGIELHYDFVRACEAKRRGSRLDFEALLLTMRFLRRPSQEAATRLLQGRRGQHKAADYEASRGL